jgi:hypothetical protein
MYIIQLYALTGAHSFGFRFPTVTDAIGAAAILAAKRTFEWGAPTAFRIIETRSGVVVVDAASRKARRFTKSRKAELTPIA